MKGLDLKRLLTEAGLKPTSRRLLLLSVLEEGEKPLSATELFKKARQKGPIDRVTVYRLLETFFKAGLLDRLKSGSRSFCYHLVAGPGRESHPHFYCKACGVKSCLEPGLVKLDYSRLKDLYPAQVDHLEVTLEGLCPACLARTRKKG